jgi:beta-lactam-binding protein with PASTA domain
MRQRTAVIATLAAAAILALTACEGSTTDAEPDRSAGQQTPEPSPTSNKGRTSETATLPDFIGKGLQSAQDEAQAAGFYTLDSHDALGRGRMQALDRNWKVCSQTPAPGAHPTDTEVDFGTVKLEETCPARDAEEPAEAGATMPDLRGKSVKVARRALDSSTSITVRDASGQDRMVLIESNWKVCHLSPAVGAELDGKPVTIGAVKFDEEC